MEFPEVGLWCSFSECQKLNFLPFPCKACGLTFCKDHRLHGCELVQPQVFLNRITSFPCSMVGCSERLRVDIAGPSDGRKYCIQHRHGSGKEEAVAQKAKLKAWQVPKAQYKIAKREVDRQVDVSLKKAIKKEDKKETALKIQLMRIKMRAVGAKQTPSDRRTYFLVHPPAVGPSQGPKALHVDCNWTLGRAVDKVAQVLKARNDNNVAGRPRLALYRKTDGELVSGVPGGTVGDLLGAGGLVQGETLVLEYGPEGQTRLENLQAYVD